VIVLAAIRPDSWNVPLLVHILGSMVLVGATLAAATALIAGWRRDAGPYMRFAFWTLLIVALPAWLVMRLGAQWIYSKYDFAEDPTWVGIGLTVSEPGLLLLLGAIVVTGIGARRSRTAVDGAPSTLGRVGAVLSVILLAAYVVAVWAMSAKPD
jgi:hypothetical protein